LIYNLVLGLVGFGLGLVNYGLGLGLDGLDTYGLGLGPGLGALALTPSLLISVLQSCIQPEI